MSTSRRPPQTESIVLHSTLTNPNLELHLAVTADLRGQTLSSAVQTRAGSGAWVP